jgi:hypothetical protein
MIAMDLYIGRRAILSLQSPEGQKVTKMVFPHMFQHGHSTMKFDFKGTTSLALKYDNNFYVSGNTLLDFSAISYTTRIEHFKHKGETDWGNVNLGTIKFSRCLQVEDHVNAVNI